MLKTAHVQFKNEKYNYKTSVNGQCSDEEIKPFARNLQPLKGCLVIAWKNYKKLIKT